MRVGFTGTHRTGKSTLIEAISAALPHYDVIDEPYRLLEDDGYDDPDFERQLALSLELARDLAADALVDRTPIDFVAYLRASGDDDADEIDLDAAREAMGAFDLIVFVPIEEPDRIALPSSEPRRLRAAVDELLRALVADLEIPTIEVTGDVPARVRQVMRALASR